MPGDAVMVLAGGNDYLEVADSIDRAAQRMSRLESGGMISEALDALMERKEETVADIQKAHARYAATGRALVDYAGVLSAAQDDSATALERARAAAADAEDASGRQRYYVDLADGAQDESERSQWERLAAQFGGDADAAHGTVAAARSDIDTAVDMRDRAAERAIGDIEDITQHDGLKDGWWDDWGADLVAAITDIAGWVSTIAGVLALAVAWIPVIGQALAGVLLIVAAVAAIVNAIGNIALASTGERSWTEAVISIAGAALSCIGLGGAAKAIGRLVTTRVLLRDATTGTAKSAAKAAATAFKPRDALRLLRNDPSALVESAGQWLRPVVRPQVGDEVFRLYGGSSQWYGKSWSPVDPRVLHDQRSTLGMPSGGKYGTNDMTDLIVGRLNDVSHVEDVRHALPMDGFPGGAPEYVIDWSRTGAVERLDDIVMAVR
ncbi:MULTISPECIES: putative T7SS-secreted protein [Isoptericola]|uniref:putative T7SS-secreted protein n=1 Tax=Isoptericola TaxID=254250 RepID=UPI000F6466D3|nr:MULTISPECIES: hypothetical protein [Isoptericola]